MAIGGVQTQDSPQVDRFFRVERELESTRSSRNETGGEGKGSSIVIETEKPTQFRSGVLKAQGFGSFIDETV